MPISNIMTVHMSVLGLCFLKGRQKELLKTEWKDRFGGRTSLWVDLEVDSSFEQIRDAVLTSIREREGMYIQQECVMAVFLDLQEAVPEHLPETLKRIQETLDLVLNRSTVAVLQFGYVGIRGLSDGKIVRENTAMLSGENAKRPAAIQYRVCLVGSDFSRSGDENNWRAVALFLDILRRQNSIVGFLPVSPNGQSNDDIGYLRYAEYNKIRYQDCKRREEKIRQLLGKGGNEELFRLYENRRNELRKTVQQRYVIEENMHPQHPDLIVTGMLSVTRAKKGKHKPYNEAAERTRNAVLLTAKRMESEIKKLFAPYILNAEEELLSMFETAKVGLELKKDRGEMNAILSVTRAGGLPALPLLPYSEAGVSGSICTYLKQMRSYVTDSCLEEYENSIRSAYDRILEKGFADEEQRLAREMQNITDTMRNLQTPEKIIVAIQNGSYLPETGLAPGNVEGRQKSYMLIRGEEVRRKVESMISSGTTQIYELMQTADDAQSIQDMPAKAVQMMVSDCSEYVLQGMINWG